MANIKSISQRCHLREVACVWELTKESIHLPLGKTIHLPLVVAISGQCTAPSWRASARQTASSQRICSTLFKVTHAWICVKSLALGSV